MEWISVKDKMPENKKTVLCFIDARVLTHFQTSYTRDGIWYGNECDTELETDGFIVTHWMPLPESPKN